MVALVSSTLALASCGRSDNKPFPEERFRQIASKCGFKAVTYTPRKTFWFGEEPLIDFSREPNSERAVDCFNQANQKMWEEHTNEADLGVVFIWEVRS